VDRSQAVQTRVRNIRTAQHKFTQVWDRGKERDAGVSETRATQVQSGWLPISWST